MNDSPFDKRVMKENIGTWAWHEGSHCEVSGYQEANAQELRSSHS